MHMGRVISNQLKNRFPSLRNFNCFLLPGKERRVPLRWKWVSSNDSAAQCVWSVAPIPLSEHAKAVWCVLRNQNEFISLWICFETGNRALSHKLSARHCAHQTKDVESRLFHPLQKRATPIGEKDFVHAVGDSSWTQLPVGARVHVYMCVCSPFQIRAPLESNIMHFIALAFGHNIKHVKWAQSTCMMNIYWSYCWVTS